MIYGVIVMESRKVTAIFGDLTAQFVHNSLQRIFDTAAQGNFKLAYMLFRLFIMVHPGQIREPVLKIIEDPETKAEAEKVYSEYLGGEDDASKKYGAMQEYYRVILERGLKELGNRYAEYKTFFKPFSMESV